MIKNKLVAKYFLVGMMLTSVFLLIAFFTTNLLLEAERNSRMEMERNLNPNSKNSKTNNNGENLKAGGNYPPPNFRPFDGPPPGGDRGDGGPPPFDGKNGPEDFGNRPKMRPPFFKIIGMQFLAILLGISSTFAFVFFHFKSRTKDIEETLERIKNGDLKARMNITNHDEFGLAMKNFNIMADEIEALVNRLRQTEATRRVLLSELAHDIRTPLASVKNLVEILIDKKDDIDVEKSQELLKLSHNEVIYIAQLVEDLLFLGRIEEPSYQKNARVTELSEIINEVSSSINVRYPNIKASFVNKCHEDYEIDEVLGTRLVRNILENAYSFARESIFIKIYNDHDDYVVEVSDDGPGLSDSELKSYGTKKFSRKEVIDQEAKKRISIGLGAVIVKTIVEIYHGHLFVSNNTDNGKISGAKIQFKLPKID